MFLFGFVGVAASDFFCKPKNSTLAFFFFNTVLLIHLSVYIFLVPYDRNITQTGPNLSTIAKQLHLSESMVSQSVVTSTLGSSHFYASSIYLNQTH